MGRAATRHRRPARGGDEGPADAERLHHRAALLQAAEQHRRAHRPPLERERAAARRGHVHERDRVRLAGAGARRAGARSPPAPPTCLLLLAGRPLRLQPRLLHGRRWAAAPCARPPPATASTSTAPRPRSRTDTGTRPTTGSTRTSPRRAPADTRAPEISGSTPADGANDVAPTTKPTVTFDEAMNAVDVTASTITLKNELNATVPASVSYDAATPQGHAEPRGRRSRSGTPTRSRSSAARAASRTRRATRSPRTVPGASARPPLCPCTVFAPSDGPLGDATADSPLEVGMKFRSTEDGCITALRFYKQPNNTGTHVGHLWTADGTKLAEVTFTNETPSGWQEASAPGPDPDHQGHDVHHVVPLRAAVASASAPATSPAARPAPPCRRRATWWPAATASTSTARARSRTPRSARPTTGSTRRSTAPPRWTTARRRSRIAAPPRTRRVSRSTRRSRSTFDEPIDRLTVNTGSLVAQGQRRQPRHRHRRLRRGDAHRHADAVGALAARQDLHRDGQERQRRRDRHRGQPAHGRPVMDVLDRRRSARARSSTRRPRARPAPTANHDQPLELGVKFRATEDGYITGAALLQAGEQHRRPRRPPVGGRTASCSPRCRSRTRPRPGWQSAELPNPVAITKDTVYVASYYSPGGYFPFDQGYFTTAA